MEIYSDGAYNWALEQGGWAVVVVESSQKQVFSGMAKRTTNNRMEITAALEGILHTPQGVEMTVHTDSTYLFGCAAKGWRRKANLDLWEQVDKAVSQHKVHWVWLDQNARNPFHEEVHTLANTLASQTEMVLPVPAEKEKVAPKVTVTPELTHLDASGQPRMVAITEKPDTYREAIAKGLVRMQASTLELIKKGEMAKGNVLAVAKLAGIMAAKQTATLIPLCHPILIGDVSIEFNLDEKNSTVEITTAVESIGKTGVEMEALTATAVTALTICDMCKAVDRGMSIENIRLVRKSGGKSGTLTLE